jgi:hypothetical protein
LIVINDLFQRGLMAKAKEPQETLAPTEELAPVQAAAAEPEPKPLLLADPRIAPELMTPEQKNAFYLKNRARILVANGYMTVDQAFEANLISQADATAMKLGQDLSEPLPVLEAPAGSPKPVGERCC